MRSRCIVVKGFKWRCYRLDFEIAVGMLVVIISNVCLLFYDECIMEGKKCVP